MRAFLPISQAVLNERRRMGHDRRDEMWKGTLHMVPPPHEAHQRLNDRLGLFFQLHWELIGALVSAGELDEPNAIGDEAILFGWPLAIAPGLPGRRRCL